LRTAFYKFDTGKIIDFGCGMWEGKEQRAWGIGKEVGGQRSEVRDQRTG